MTGVDKDRNSVLDATEISKTEIVCDGKDGNAGPSGRDGDSGQPGSNGHSVVFELIPASTQACPAGGTTIILALDINDTGAYDPQLPNQQSTSICNGQDAPTSAYMPVQVITPCGKTVPYKEVLLRLENGEVLASFSETSAGLNTRLALLPDGAYVDTDQSSCVFTLASSADGKTRSISWAGQTQHTWAIKY
jgi:hypothetical protein